jgi:hypothetical protein
MYLRPNYAVYHVRAVNLVWSLQAATNLAHVESILAQSMACSDSRNVRESYEAFGVLWRLTGQLRCVYHILCVSSLEFQRTTSFPGSVSKCR